MMDKDHSSQVPDAAAEGSSRRDFLRKGARVLYIAPLVVSYDISEVYDAESGYALAGGTTPVPMHHGEK